MTSGFLALGDTDSSTPQLEGVGVGRRVAARLIDLVVLQIAIFLGASHAVILALIVGVFLGPAMSTALAKVAEDPTMDVSRLWEIVLGFSAIIAMHTFCEGLHGSTVGKRLCGITAVSEDGTPAGLTAAFKRSAGFLVDQLFFGLVGIHRIHSDPKAQRVGDSWAGTMVVRLDALPPSSRRTTGRFVLAAIAGLGAAALVSFLAVAGLIAYQTITSAGDGVEILEVSAVPDQRLRPGEDAVFAVRVQHELKSALVGKLEVFVLDGEESVPVGGRVDVMRAEATSTLKAYVTIPETPSYDDFYLITLGVGLLPGLNEQSFDAYHLYDVELGVCEESEAEEPGDLCVVWAGPA